MRDESISPRLVHPMTSATNPPPFVPIRIFWPIARPCPGCRSDSEGRAVGYRSGSVHAAQGRGGARVLAAFVPWNLFGLFNRNNVFPKTIARNSKQNLDSAPNHSPEPGRPKLSALLSLVVRDSAGYRAGGERCGSSTFSVRRARQVMNRKTDANGNVSHRSSHPPMSRQATLGLASLTRRFRGASTAGVIVVMDQIRRLCALAPRSPGPGGVARKGCFCDRVNQARRRPNGSSANSLPTASILDSITEEARRSDTQTASIERTRTKTRRGLQVHSVGR